MCSAHDLVNTSRASPANGGVSAQAGLQGYYAFSGGHNEGFCYAVTLLNLGNR